MAKIMIDAKKQTKFKRDNSNESWEDAQARICVFDENDEDGVSFSAFEKIHSQQDEWFMLNNAGSYTQDGKVEYYAARQARLSAESESHYVLKVYHFSVESAGITYKEESNRSYKLQKEVVDAFGCVAVATKMNSSEKSQRELLRQNKIQPSRLSIVTKSTDMKKVGAGG